MRIGMLVLLKRALTAWKASVTALFKLNSQSRGEMIYCSSDLGMCSYRAQLTFGDSQLISIGVQALVNHCRCNCQKPVAPMGRMQLILQMINLAPSVKGTVGVSIDAHALLLWSCAGAIAKTAVAPIERVKLILQTQDLNPRIRRGEIPPYKGGLSCLAALRASPFH